MKALKVILKIAAACAALAGVLFLVAAYWDKLTELFARRGELKEKAYALKDKIPSAQQIREKIPTKEAILEKLPTKEDIISKFPTKEDIVSKFPTKEDIIGKFPTKEELIRLNPFRKAEIEAEFADYADVE